MEIKFIRTSAKKMCPDAKCLRSFGDPLGRMIVRRFNEFRAAVRLEDLRRAPGRHEELTGNRKSQLSCRLDANRRLIYKPFGDPHGFMEDNKLVWGKVDKVEVVEVTDYH